MTREEAISAVLVAGSRVIDRLRNDRPQWLCDTLEIEAAEDTVDVFVALGILKLDEDPKPLTQDQFENLNKRST